MVAWLKKHTPQLLVLIASALVALGLHFGKLTIDDAVAVGGALAAVGIHLPAIVYRVPGPSKPPPLPVLFMLVSLFVVGCMTVLLACGSSTPSASAPNPAAAACVAHRTVKELECVDLYQTKAEIDACRAKVKAAVECVDGGVEDGGGQ